MPRPGSRLFLVAIALLTLAVAVCQWAGAAWLERIDLAIHDALMRMGRTAPRDPSLVFLARDTASANLETTTDLEQLFDLEHADAPSRRALHLMVNEWPWSREIHALVLDRLIQAGARAVVFDFTFPKPSPNDEPFRESLARHRERVVLAANITDDPQGGLDGLASAFGVPTDGLIPQTSPRDPRIGFDNFWPDRDGVIREAHYRWAMTHGMWQSPDELSLASRALQQAGLGGVAPADHLGRRLRFAGPPGTFTPRSIYELFVPAYWERNYGSGAFFRDKIVVIGAAGNWQQDEHLTPMGMMPGPEIHLNAINAALQSSFVAKSSGAVGALFVAASAAAGLLLRRQTARPFARFGGQLAATAAWGGIALALFDSADLLVPCFAPLFVFNLTGVGGLALDIMIERREKTQIRRTLERYVSRNVVEELIDSPDQFNRALGGDLRQVTILFSDIRSFTRAAATMDSRALVTQLNEYFAAMVECVFRFGGTLDKFIGDAVMAVWGNTRSNGPAADATNAVRCARAMREELAKLNARWAEEGRPQFRIGIGLNAGEVICGNIGSPHRMEFTVIGDAVNVAWRLQEKTKHGPNILFGDSVAERIEDDFPCTGCGELHLPDHEPVPYSCLAEDRQELPIATTAARSGGAQAGQLAEVPSLVG